MPSRYSFRSSDRWRASDRWAYLRRPAPRMGYVPGLDGIRAIAVLGVLFYHGSASWLPGGFLGVDVFFVLSRFLISTLLFEQLAARGRIDFRTFYLHRARRLLPASFLAGALLQPLFGWVMDLGWRGELANGARVYDLAAWRSGVLVVTLCALLGAIASWWIKETRCRNIWQAH